MCITCNLTEHIIIIQERVTWNWNAHTVVNSNSVKNKSLYLFYIPGLVLFSIGALFKRCVDCTLNKIECDFAKIECLVSPLSLSIRQYKINSLHRNLLWVVLLRQFAVFWGQGNSRYIYHPLPPATIQPTSSHWAEVLMGALALEFHIIMEVQGSKRQMNQGHSRSLLRKRSQSMTLGDGDQRWVHCNNTKYVCFSLPLMFFFSSGNPSLKSEFLIVLRIFNSYWHGSLNSTTVTTLNMAKTNKW